MLKLILDLLDELGDEDSEADGAFRKTFFVVEAEHQLFDPRQHGTFSKVWGFNWNDSINNERVHNYWLVIHL